MEYASVWSQQSISGEIVSLIPGFFKSGHNYLCCFKSNYFIERICEAL